MSILKQIVESTFVRVENEKKIGLPTKRHRTRFPFLFEQCLNQKNMSFICEIKKASPSKGIITEDFPYMDIAKDYKDAGADAISILTEPEYFAGSESHLIDIRREIDIPLLRKDFIVDPFQIEQSFLLGADAILLICAVLSSAQLKDYIKIADGFGLSCLVEVYNLEELSTALRAGTRIIGVNNRNLNTFTVNINNTVKLSQHVPEYITFVSESGISTEEDISFLQENGVDAVLIGEALMRSPDKKTALKTLKKSTFPSME